MSSAPRRDGPSLSSLSSSSFFWGVKMVMLRLQTQTELSHSTRRAIFFHNSRREIHPSDGGSSSMSYT